MSDNAQMFIDGRWVDARDGAVYEDMNPYTGEVYARVASGGAEDARLAVDAAHRAFPTWAATTAEERRDLFLKAAEIMERRVPDFAEALTQETGAVRFYAGVQAHSGVGLLKEAAAQTHEVEGKILPSDTRGLVSMAWRQPVGVVACISPWNAPVALSFRAVVFPLAYGNTVVLKTSEASSMSGGVLIAQVFEEAGFPPGVINLVTNGPGRSGEIGRVLTGDPRVRRLTFTGSTEVGRALAVQAAQNLKKITLELGGSCPLIVLSDADLEYAVNTACFGRFCHQGQICMSTKRVVVEAPIAEAFIARVTAKAQTLPWGDPRDPKTLVGPLINEYQATELETQVENARKQGAEVLCGGRRHGNVYEPTVLRMTEEMDIAREEVFGPVMCVIVARDAQDALRIANGTAFGLSSAVVSGDVMKAWTLAEGLEAGCTHINSPTLYDEPRAPLGGTKASGWGSNGYAAIEEFTELRWVTLQKTPRPYPF